MSNNTDQLNELLSRLNSLTRKQEDFAQEISELRDEILEITRTANQPEPTQPFKENTKTEIKNQPNVSKPVQINQPSTLPNKFPEYKPNGKTNDRKKINRNLEKVIGENLISKIGIVILVLGVAIGTKYAIEHELISPLTRIIMGYMVGVVLLGFAVKLKRGYDNFSAVLLSGAMAILYFITFAAYNFFGLLPQVLTFTIMVVFTVFTVLASLNYNKPIIAHFGLVGAYAIPFLLSDGSGKVVILFSYMAIINAGILAIAFRKYWKSLNYVAFGLTWLIYVSWYMSSYQVESHVTIASIFLLIFFAGFYSTFLVYKLAKKEKFDSTDVILILANSFIFYGMGYAILDNYPHGSQLLGLFTLCNALLHSVISILIYKHKLADRYLFYMVSGLVLIFIAIAIPVQFDGNWVTLLWAGEAALLFWIGRTKKAPVYEGLSYLIMVLSFISLFQDWIISSNILTNHTQINELPFFNIQFFTSLLFIAAFGFILMLNRNIKYPSVFISQKEIFKSVSTIISVTVIVTLYVTFFNEISLAFDQSYLNPVISKSKDGSVIYDVNILSFKTCWLINYSLLFTSILSFINIKWIKNASFAKTTLFLSGLVVLISLTVELYHLSVLRVNYLKQIHLGEVASINFLIIRYATYIFIAISIFANSINVKGNLADTKLKNNFTLFLHATILWVLSSELINWMDLLGYSGSYKLGITILWGVYSLAMIVLGIWKKNKVIRVAAIVLFGVTLAKLFLYDLSSLTTIAKTIVMVSLGILLLVISFLYTKYKQSIFEESDG